MKIIKKDGRIQEFDKSKISTSISNAASGYSMTESDLKMVVEDIIKLLNKIRKDETPTSSYEIIGVITDVLVQDGFTQVLKEYIVHE